jgi:hypothetical protein
VLPGERNVCTKICQTSSENSITSAIHYGSIGVSVMVGTSGKAHAWYVNQELNVLANKGAVHVRAHVECEMSKEAVRAEMNCSKVTSFFLHQEDGQLVLC